MYRFGTYLINAPVSYPSINKLLQLNPFLKEDFLHFNSAVESHCSECPSVWFEWQNRAVEREKEKWIEYNGELANKINGVQIFKQ
jgi:hypothetical protein